MHPLQAAFWEHHSLQCGFCTPGMLMTAHELLERNPQPDEQEIRDALSGNLCRCTGYQHIVDAIQAAGGEQQWPLRPRQWIGRDIKRREDPALLTGSATFTNDFALPGMLHAAVLRSPHPHALITSVDCDGRAGARGRRSRCSAGAELAELIDPLPRFCAEEVVEHAVAVDKVRYAGEAVAIAVAETRYLAEDALELVEIDYELLEPLVDPVAAASPGAPLVHENLGTNVVYEKTFTHGDVEGDFARAAHVIRAHAALAARVRVADGARRRGLRVRPRDRAHGRALELEHAQLRRLGAVGHAEDARPS